MSVLPKEWKRIFRDVLTAREEVLLAIPDKNKLDNMRAVRALQFTQGPFMRSVKDLMGKMKAKYPDADWPEYESGFDKLSGYEFMMSPNLPSEASDWVFAMHGLMSVLYTLMVNRMEAEGVRIPLASIMRKIALRIATVPSSRLARIARRVARLAAGTFHLRDSMLHVDPGTVQESSLEQELKMAFLDALQIKENFQKAIPMNPKMCEDIKTVDRLDDKAGSVVFALRGLAEKVKAVGKNLDSKTESAISKLGEHAFVPSDRGTLHREADGWAWNSHEVISKLFDLATDAAED